MKYAGSELELFREAVRWKRYWAGEVRAYVRGRVLDVGCGLGANAEYLWNEGISSYTFLEPDAELLTRTTVSITDAIRTHAEFVHGTTAELHGRKYDCILYIDVLEHIASPTEELERAAALLAPGGHLIILVPAFQFLFSPFDAAVGHHRRYTRKSLEAELPSGLNKISMRYLDSAGMLLSIANKLFLRQTVPTSNQIAFWDRRIVPISTVTDRILCQVFGRSLLSVLRKTN